MAAMVAACDESFDPIAPSELAFSVFGQLDASADTQWIRVMPIRSLRETSPDALGATVTLEHLATGRIIELRDSLFEFSSPSADAGPSGVYVHNFWTPEQIEPGGAYRFSATREGKQPAVAVVEIPHDYEVEVAIIQSRAGGATDELLITGVKHLPFLTMATYFYDSCGSSSVGADYGRHSADDETYLIAIEKKSVAPRTGCGTPIVTHRALGIVASEVVWPAGGQSPGALGQSGWTTNVSNAVGFLGGVLTKIVPYEECEFQSDAPPPSCRLRYNPETATMVGTVRETRCGDGPIDSATVRLTELNQDPARIRSVMTTQAGTFVIGALEPGISHALWARAPQVPSDSVFDVRTFSYVYTAWKDVHTVPTDTLTFMPGQRIDYDIDLERLTPCTEPPPVAQ